MTTRIVDAARTCQAPGCPRPTSPPRSVLCRECHRLVYVHVEAALADIITVVGGSPIHVGRTAHPERRAFEHWEKLGLNRLTLLHCAHSWEEGDCMESLAHGTAARLGASLSGSKDDPCGRRSGHLSWIYAAYGEDGRARRSRKGVTAITELHPRDRLMPSVEIPTPIFHMRVEVSRAEAETALDGWWRRTKGERRAR